MRTRTKIGWLLPTLGVILLGLVGTGPALAQTGEDRTAVRRELEKTAHSIEQAEDHLRGQDCEKGRRFLDQAKGLQRRAVGEFLANSRPATRIAVRLTREARDQVVRSIQACQVEFRALEEVRRLLESTRDFAADATPRIRGSGVVEAVHLLDAGLGQLQKANQAYRSEEFRRAIRLGTIARNLIQRALHKASGAGLVEGQMEQSMAACDRTQELIGEVRSALVIRESKKGAALLDQAEKHQERALEFLRDRQWRQAFRFTEMARARALEASWQSEEAPGREQIERAVEIVSEMIVEMASEIRSRGGNDASILLEKAEEKLADARSHLAAGENRAAARTARLAATLLQRAAERSGLR